ncbi:MAG: hypothetical protein ICV64_12375 [Thermoleophilia bacterium]|nr:hypothetical protein [Thermoleophilia bacterium]
MQSPEPTPARARVRRSADRPVVAGGGEGLWTTGERLTLVAGLVLAVSAFTGWYVGSGEGLTISVIGWHTGTLGKLVFFVGALLVALVVLRAAGIELPGAVPESLIVIVLGSLATIFVLIRIIDVPERFVPADGRAVGIWISLVAALAVIAAGLLQASEEL